MRWQPATPWPAGCYGRPLAARWAAAVVVDLASWPVPLWCGFGRPAARDGTGVGRTEVLHRLSSDNVRLHGESAPGSSHQRGWCGVTFDENHAIFSHGGR